MTLLCFPECLFCCHVICGSYIVAILSINGWLQPRLPRTRKNYVPRIKLTGQLQISSMQPAPHPSFQRAPPAHRHTKYWRVTKMVF